MVTLTFSFIQLHESICLAMFDILSYYLLNLANISVADYLSAQAIQSDTYALVIEICLESNLVHLSVC